MKIPHGVPLLAGLLAFAIVVLAGCGKKPESAHQSWTGPTKVWESRDSLSDGAIMYPYGNTLIALQHQMDASAKWFVLNLQDGTNNSWNEVASTNVPPDYFWVNLGTEQATNKVLLVRGYMENEELVMSILLGRLSVAKNVALGGVIERKWITEKKALFGETGSNVRLTDKPGTREGAGVGRGFLNGSEVYVPYCLQGKTFFGKTRILGPFNNGFFHSADLGKTWEMEKLSDFDSGGAAMCKTEDFHYYFAVRYPGPMLWFSRKAIDGGSWGAPQDITKTFSQGWPDYMATVGANDTVHLCWLDRRHEKIRLNPFDPFRGNYEVVYCHRSDSDAAWSKHSILSKGMLYSYSPSMSVQGNKIIVAWAGVKTARDGHTEYRPNDIYYVTSKDAGKTWGKPINLTNAAKDGMTSGEPQVVLRDGIIHLTYIQGQLNLKQESPGLTKLNQPPWPIYYRRATFPN